jgi:RNA polymerase sigma-70 factor (ECF subfamily)
MVERSDAELIILIRQGDEQAFRELVIKYQTPIYNLALRMTKSQADAEEVCQAVFVKVFEKLNTYNPDYSFFSWLYRMAMNESINTTKRNRRTFSLDAAPAGPQPAAPPLPSFELSDAIQDALMLLPPTDRAMVVLRHFQHMSYQEIAYVLNSTETKVKAHLFSARRSLKDILLRMGINNEN